MKTQPKQVSAFRLLRFGGVEFERQDVSVLLLARRHAALRPAAGVSRRRRHPVRFHGLEQLRFRRSLHRPGQLQASVLGREYVFVLYQEYARIHGIDDLAEDGDRLLPGADADQGRPAQKHAPRRHVHARRRADADRRPHLQVGAASRHGTAQYVPARGRTRGARAALADRSYVGVQVHHRGRRLERSGLHYGHPARRAADDSEGLRRSGGDRRRRLLEPHLAHHASAAGPGADRVGRAQHAVRAENFRYRLRADQRRPGLCDGSHLHRRIQGIFDGPLRRRNGVVHGAVHVHDRARVFRRQMDGQRGEAR